MVFQNLGPSFKILVISSRDKEKGQLVEVMHPIRPNWLIAMHL